MSLLVHRDDWDAIEAFLYEKGYVMEPLCDGRGDLTLRTVYDTEYAFYLYELKKGEYIPEIKRRFVLKDDVPVVSGVFSLSTTSNIWLQDGNGTKYWINEYNPNKEVYTRLPINSDAVWSKFGENHGGGRKRNKSFYMSISMSLFGVNENSYIVKLYPKDLR